MTKKKKSSSNLKKDEKKKTPSRPSSDPGLKNQKKESVNNVQNDKSNNKKNISIKRITSSLKKPSNKNNPSSSNLKKGEKKKTPSRPSIDPGLKNQKKESVNNVQNDECNNEKNGITIIFEKPSNENNPYCCHSKVSFHPDVSNSHKTSKADFSCDTNNLDNSHVSLVKKKSSKVYKVKSKLSKLFPHTDTSRKFNTTSNNDPFNSFSFPDSFYTYSLMNQDYDSRSFTRDMYPCDRSNRSCSNTGPHKEEKKLRIFDILPQKKYTPENLKDLQMLSENLVRFCEDLSEAERIVSCREQSQFVHIETMVEIASRNFVEDLVRLDGSLESTLVDGRLHER